MAKTIERGIESMAGIELRKPDDAAGVIEWSVARGLNPVCHLGAGRSGQQHVGGVMRSVRSVAEQCKPGK